jgi:Protein kinase domain
MNDPDETIERPQAPDVADAPTIPPSESAAALVRILDQYMAAVQAGEAPDRAALLAEHPELASQLEPCLAGIDFIQRAAAPGSSEAEPAMLGEFRIVREVGRGGMGVVYEAEQTSLRRRVALKVLRFGVVADEEALRRFRVEAETVARLHHTNIVPIFAVGTEHDVSYYAMQFIEGRSLADVQEESHRLGRPILGEDVARWGLQAAEALAHAHQRRVIHRDVKPSNLLIDSEGVLWLTDFGLAKRSDEVTLTLSGTLMGTPRYMSPEQAEAMKRPVDHRTDVYSLGASLYELATGRPVFESSTAHGVIMQVLTAEPAAPRSIRPDVPRDLETILLTCLAKDPDRRYATAQALAEDLRSFLEGRSIKARRTPIWEKAARYAKRQKKSAAIGAIAAVVSVLLAGAGLAFWRSNEEAKLGRLNLSTQGETFTAEILRADRDERVIEPFTVPTRSPVPLPEGDYRVRLSAPGKLSDTYQLHLERWLAQDFQVDLTRRDLWAAGQRETTQTTWRAYPITIDGRTDLIEVDQQSVTRRMWAREPVWSFDVSDQARLPAGADPKSWGILLWASNGPSNVQLPPVVLRSMPDLNGDGVGDVVVSSRQLPIVVALSGKDGKILWHRKAATEEFPDPKAEARWAGEPLVFEGPDGPVLVTTIEFRKVGALGIEARRVEAMNGRDGRKLWRRDAVRHDGRSIPAQRIRLDGKNVVGLVSGPEWLALNPLSGDPLGPPLNFDDLNPGRTRNQDFHLLREPGIADLDGDGSDDLLVLLATANLNQPELMAVSARDRRLLWKEVVNADYIMGDDSRDPEATWPRLADLDGDGRAEVLVPYQADSGPARSRLRSVGLRALDGKDGRERWSHRLRTDREMKPSSQFIAGPDVDGDGVRDVFIADAQPVDFQIRGNVNQSTLYVDAISGRDGRSLWWWSQSVLSEYLQFRPLRWWEPGADGFPKLVVDAGSDLVAFRDLPQVFAFEASTGKLVHEGINFHPTGSADLSGDGLPELWGTAADRANPSTVRRVVAFGRPAEVWKRLGRWQLGRDYDADGVPDLVGPEASRHNEVDAISGRDGHVLWKAAPGQSGQKIVITSDAPEFRYVPFPEKLGDLDGDGAPEVAVTREQTSRAVRNGRLTVGLGVCSGRTGKILWENPEVPWDDRYMSWCAPCNVMAIDVEGRGRADVFSLLHIQGSRPQGTAFLSFGEFYLARFSGETGRVMAIEKVHVRNEGTQWNDGLPVREFANAVADLDGDGRPEIVFELPRHSPTGQRTGDFVAVSAVDGKVVWKHAGAMRLDHLNAFDDAWKRFAAADLDGDGKSEVILVDVVDDKPRVERWDLANRSSPRWIWQGGESDGGAVREISAIPRLINLDGSGRKGVVVIADQEKAGRRVVVLDPEGHVVRSRPIESKMLGHRIWAGDLDGDGKNELLFEDRGKLCALRGDLTTELWASATIGAVQEIRLVAQGGIEVDLGNGVALNGSTGRTIATPGWLANPRLIDGPDPTRPMALEVDNAQTTAYRTIPTDATSPPARISVAAHPDPDDPRVVRPLPWVVGSPGGLAEKDRAYLPAIAFWTLATGVYSFVVLVWPILIFRKMIQGKAKVRDLLLMPIIAAVIYLAYSLLGSLFGGNNSFAHSQAMIFSAILVVAGLPVLAIAVETVRAFRRRGWWALLGLLTFWAIGCGIAAALLIYSHYRDWMSPGERYGWEGWWTIWLPGLYASGCLLIVWKVVSWPVKRLVRWRRAVA